MADKYLNYTGLNYYHSRAKVEFASASDLSDLSERVDDIVAEGGEPNVIEVVQKNGTALPISNKTVNVTVPTSTSQLTNDGDSDSPFATEDYVDENGGKIDVIKVNGTAQTISNKEVNITVPVSSSDLSDSATIAHTSDIPTKTSDLTNDSDFQTETEVQDLIDASLADITGIDFQVVQTLPQTGEHGVIYLVAKTGTTGDIYDEYIWVTPTGGTAHFEQIGTTQVDLSDYWAIADLTAITTSEIDTIVNGS